MAKALKSAVSIPVLLTGRVRDPELAESILRDGDADFIAMVRPLIADPDLPRKYAAGKTTEIWSCIACNECFRSLERHVAVRCAVNPTAGRELLYDYRQLEAAPKPKKVMVIGAGAAGMEAARVAALRGHQVTLVEKEGELGRKLEVASRLPSRKTFKDINSYYSTAFKALGSRVEIARGSEVTAELIDEMEKEGMSPDVFVVATGGSPFIPEVPGVKGSNVVAFLDVVADEAEIGERVVVVGANIIGCEIAIFLAQQGKKVTLLELPGFRAGSDLDGLKVEGNIWAATEQELDKSNITLVTAAKLAAITDKGVSVEDSSGKRLSLNADTVVLSLGFTAENKLTRHLTSKGKEVYTIGDASKTRKIKDAAYEGFLAASRI
jgi:pyruvate/2-oxoglutarate dehydrogenase complex dihydrolipoamide dehydrogenase (E3) component